MKLTEQEYERISEHLIVNPKAALRETARSFGIKDEGKIKSFYWMRLGKKAKGETVPSLKISNRALKHKNKTKVEIIEHALPVARPMRAYNAPKPPSRVAVVVGTIDDITQILKGL